MSNRRPNPRRVKIHRTYDVSEIATLFGIHRNTVRAWLRAGLSTTDSDRPLLVLGRDLVSFLERRMRAARKPCGPGEMFCLKCRSPRAPVAHDVVYRALSGTQGNLVGRCSHCATVMNRRVRLSNVDAALSHFGVHGEMDEKRIGNSPASSLHSDFDKELPDHAHA